MATSEMAPTKLETAPLLQSIVIKGTEGLLVNFAECCRPIPGDCVVGILQAGQGIIIHQGQCKQIKRFRKHPEKYLSVFWDSKVQGYFKVDIHIEVANQQGVLAELAGAVSKAHANIDNVSVEEREGNFCVVRLTIAVHNRAHLAQVLRRLRCVKAVTKLARGR
jgi:GTP diphosphokinase / guanosine-3',5'-bis(diphosphate) 3'-diphosphatase